MKREPILRALVALVALCLPAFHAASAFGQAFAQFPGHKLPMVQRSVLKDVDGKLNHMAFDLKSGRLYVACKATSSVEALDARGMKTAQSVKDVPEPISLSFLQDSRRLVVGCGDGTVRVFKANDAGELTKERDVEFRGQVGTVRYDPKAKLVWVGFGKFISSFDPEIGKAGSEIELPGVGEAFVLEADGPRLFVNIAKTGKVCVVDRATGKLADTWSLKDTTGNNAMAIDEASSRLFIAARTPAVMIALDMKDGREVARVEIGADCDDLWYDAKAARVFASCGGGGGGVYLIQQKSADQYVFEHREATSSGASTSLLVSERRRLIIASPKIGPDGYTFLYIFVIPP